MVAVIIGLLAHAAITYMGLLRLMTQMKYKTFFSGMAPAQLLAFSTSSSGATLPVTMERCEEELGVRRRFLLCITTRSNYKYGWDCALPSSGCSIYCSNIEHVTRCWSQLTIVLTTVLASIGTAAVPGAGIVMLVIILEAVGVPSAGIALILGVDRILDMVRPLLM